MKFLTNKILPAIIASTFLQSCQVAQQADKAFYDLTGKVTSVDAVTGRRTLSSADRDKQIREGNKALRALVGQYADKGQPINEALNPAQFQRALRIFKKVHSVSHLRDETWEMFLVPESSFNAYTTGGTGIVIHEGLMKQLAFDDDIASVIAHEIAHVSANHVFEGQATQMASLIGGSESAKTAAVQAAYSTNNEMEADKIGLLYTALSGYDPLAASRIWQQVYKKQGNNGMGYSSHPINSDRLKINKELGEKARQYYIPGQINPEFEVILHDNVFYNNASQAPVQLQDDGYTGFGAGLTSAVQTFAGYYQDKQEAKQQARQQNERIGLLQEIQDNMKIQGGRVVDENNFEMKIKYVGSKRVGNLAIKAVSDNESSLYRKLGVVEPDETFNAMFDSKILNFPAEGGKPKIKLVVDEGEYVY